MRCSPLLLLLAACGRPTGDDTANPDLYVVASGQYIALPPEGWDGESPLPMLLYYHGHGDSAEEYSHKAWLVDGASARGLLLVLPDGENHTWSNVGSPHHDRDEMAFLDDLLADVEQRWPIDPAHRFASGFSQGASVAWDAACYRSTDFTAYFPASGSFWEPLPEQCGEPVFFRHTHGTADQTMPLEGRAIGTAQQGDVLEGIAVWRATDGCADEPDLVEVQGEVTCQIWSSCAAGGRVELCLHDGGHSLYDGFLNQVLDWAWSVSGG